MGRRPTVLGQHPSSAGIRLTKTVHRADRLQEQSDSEFGLDLILDGLKRMADG